MKYLFGVLVIASTLSAHAQTAGQLGAGQVWGNSSASTGQAAPTSLSPLFDQVFGSTSAGFAQRGASGWTENILSGDGTLSNAGALTLATVNGNVGSFGGANSIPTFTVNAKGLITAALAATPAIPWSEITSTPTSLTGYGITSPLPIAQGGTAGGTKQAALNNIMPTPTRAGDIAYYNGTNWVALAGNNSGTQVLEENSSGAPLWGTVAGTGTVTSVTCGTGLSGGTFTTSGTCALTAARQTLPTHQVFLSGSGTYSTPANAIWIEIDLVGGGGGGAGGGLTNPSGTAGNPTCWNTTGAACTTPVYEAGGGGIGTSSGGAGGTISGSSSCDWQAVGGGGGGGSVGDTFTSAPGGVGGSSSLGGGGAAIAGNVGGTAAANTGGGGAGGGINSSSASTLGGGGGGSGATCHVIIGSPASTYTYAVGGAAAGGTNGTDGSAGGPGAAGHIVVYEHYGS